MAVAYHLGSRLGHGMWSSVVGWNFGTVAENRKIKTPRVPRVPIIHRSSLLKSLDVFGHHQEFTRPPENRPLVRLTSVLR